MDFEIRPARPEELTAVGALTAAAYLDDGLLLGERDPYRERLLDARDRAEHAEVLVAAEPGSGALLGSVTYAAPGSRYAELAGPADGEFRMLAVAPAARRRGVAEALVRACLARARESGLARVVISSQPAMTAAHRLYARLGFVRMPERDWQPVPEVTLWAFAVQL